MGFAEVSMKKTKLCYLLVFITACLYLYIVSYKV